jgi:16S rRNA (cytosine1402-N4)-methyltransferase
MAFGITIATIVVGCTIGIGLFEWRDRSSMENRNAELHLWRKSMYDLNIHITKLALLGETADGLNIQPDGIYVDVTFGGGGHSKEIIKRLGAKGKLFGFDQDLDAIKNKIDDERFIFVRSNFKYLKNFLRFHNIDKVDGILADLGVSSHHFDQAERGFSFRFDGKLDMRMNTESKLTAATVLNTYTCERSDYRLYYLIGFA